MVLQSSSHNEMPENLAIDCQVQWRRRVKLEIKVIKVFPKYSCMIAAAKFRKDKKFVQAEFEGCPSSSLLFPKWMDEGKNLKKFSLKKLSEFLNQRTLLLLDLEWLHEDGDIVPRVRLYLYDRNDTKKALTKAEFDPEDLWDFAVFKG